MSRISCVFFTTCFGFVVNVVETLYTLFGAYLEYFEGL